MSTSTPTVRVGIGGWTFEPWRNGNFFPQGLPHHRELSFASRAVTTIEINGTYYATMKPASFEKWFDETPDDFVFSVKANRFCTNRRVLAEAGDSIKHFIGSGVSRLRHKLGPIVWQFAPTKVFDANDFRAFLTLLPRDAGGVPLRHAMEVRHESFETAAYVALAREYAVATVFTDSPKFPSIGDQTADFVYARLMASDAKRAKGYSDAALDTIAATAREWHRGVAPGNVPYIDDAARSASAQPRAVFVDFINGAKERAPAAALALLQRLSKPD